VTLAEIFDDLDLVLAFADAIVRRLPGAAADIAEQVLDAVSDVLPEIEALAATPGWDAGDVVAVRNILIRGLGEIPGLPMADVLSYSDALARFISEVVSAGLKQEAPVVRGRGRRRRKTLRDIDTSGGRDTAVPSRLRGAAVGEDPELLRRLQ
jgi:hypothetical protein